jgi:hypothetical protein
MTENNSMSTEATTEPTGATMTSEATTKVGEILSGSLAEQVRLITEHHDLRDELREQRKLEADDRGYHEQMPDNVKADVLQQQKLRTVGEDRERVVGELTELVAEKGERLESMRAELHEKLFSVPSEEVLLRTTLASDEELDRLAEAGIQAASEGLIRAVLNASVQRDRGEILAKIFGARPELEGVYREYQQTPSPEILQRQSNPVNIDRLVPAVDGDRLRVRPYVKQGP